MVTVVVLYGLFPEGHLAEVIRLSTGRARPSLVLSQGPDSVLCSAYFFHSTEFIGRAGACPLGCPRRALRDAMKGTSWAVL